MSGNKKLSASRPPIAPGSRPQKLGASQLSPRPSDITAPAPATRLAEHDILEASTRPATSAAAGGPAGARDAFSAIARQAAAHPLARLAEARAYERLAGKLAASHPAAARAATELLRLATSFLTTTGGFSEADLLAALTAPVSTKTGAVLAEDVAEARAHGNLREQLALIDVVARPLGEALYRVGEQAGRDPAYRAHLEKTTTLRLNTIIAKAKRNSEAVDGKRPYDALVLDERSPLHSLPQQRQARTFLRIDTQTGHIVSQTNHSVRPRHQTDRRGVDFDEHSTLPLSDREKRALHASHVAEAARSGAGQASSPDFDSIAHVRLPLTEGRHGKKPLEEHPFIAAATKAGLPTTAGISGHVYKFLSFFDDLGGDRGQLADLRLAAVAFLVPQHHSLHEVYASAATFPGLPYNPEVDTPRAIVMRLREQMGPQRAVKASDRVSWALKTNDDPGKENP